MTDFVINSEPYEPPLSAAEPGYAQTPPPFGQAFRSMVTEGSAARMLEGAAERGMQPGATDLDKAFNPVEGMVGEGYRATPPEEPNLLPAAEINKRYAPEGATITDKPMTAELGAVIGRQKTEAMQRESILARSAAVNSWPVNFGTGMAAFMLDPLNAATAVMPGIGEEAALAAVGRIGMTGVAARMSARAIAGATAGAAQQIPLTMLRGALSPEEATDYGFRDALRDVFYNAAFGAIVHAGVFGTGREIGLFRPDAIMGQPYHGPEEVRPPPAPGSEETRGAVPETAFAPDRDAALREHFEAPDRRGEPVDLRAAGFNDAEVAALHRDGLAAADGTMTADQWAAWLDEREVRAPATPEPAPEAPAVPETPKPEERVPVSPAVHADAMRGAIAEVLDGRPVDVQPVVAAAPAPPPVIRTIEQIMDQDGISAKKAAQVQIEEIAARGRPISMDEYAARRAGVGTGPRVTPADVAARQQDLARNGYATGVPDTELRATTEALYAPKPAEIPPAEKPQTAAEKTEAKGEKPPAAPKEPQRLIDYIRSLGGVKDLGGDVRHTIGGAKWRPGLVNNATGLPPDEIALRAWENGYFPEHGENRPDINDLLNKIDEDARGNPQYSHNDIDAAEAFQAARAADTEVDRLASQTGVDPTGKTKAEFYDAVAEQMSFDRAYAEMASQAEAHDAAFAEAERLAREWAAEHPDEHIDLAEIYGEPRTLEDLENEHRQEEAAPAAGAGEGGGEQPGVAAEHPGPVPEGGEPRVGGTGVAGRAGEEGGEGAGVEPAAAGERGPVAGEEVQPVGLAGNPWAREPLRPGETWRGRLAQWRATQQNMVARDVAQKLVAAGIPEDVAQASAKVWQAYYDTRAARFEGRLGTGAQLYAREAPDIVAAEEMHTEGRTLEQRLPKPPAAGAPLFDEAAQERQPRTPAPLVSDKAGLERAGQAVLPGMEPSARQAQAAREQAGPRTGQKPADEGLFATQAAQERTLFQRAEIPRVPLYSAVSRAVDGLKQARGTGEQFLAQITKTPGVKPEEMKWLGLDTWLRGQKSVTKQDVADYVRANALDVREVLRGGEPEPEQPAGMPQGWGSVGGGDRTRYAQYQLSGGTNYRELLITLPPKTQEGTEGITTENWVQHYDPVAGGARGPDVYRSPHWDEPNVLAHIRFSDRVGADGKKTLLVEEGQSDWHQTGRKKGHRGDEGQPTEYRLEQRDEPLRPGRWYAIAPDGTEIGYGTTREDAARAADIVVGGNRLENQNRVPDAPFKTSWPSLVMKRMIQYAVDHGYDRIAWTPGDVQAARYDLSKHIKDVTLHGNGDNLRITATDLHDRPVIDKQHTTREGLADIIGKEAAEKLLAQPEPSSANPYAARHLLNADLRVGGEGMRGFYDDILPKETQKIVGKFGAKVGRSEIGTGKPDRDSIKPDAQAIADHDAEWQAVLTKIREAEARKPAHTVDTPEITRLYAQLDPIHAKMIDETYARVQNLQQVHSVDITPQLREAIAEHGLPLFQRGEEGNPRGRISLLNDSRAIISLFKDADASTFMHETGHAWLEDLLHDASDPRAPEDLRADAATVRKWLGAEDGVPITDEQHERFARGFETYLMEGRAPTPTLAAVFEQFKSWLSRIYRSVTNLNAPISDDIRDVFDRLLRTDEERGEHIEGGAPNAPEAPADPEMAEAEQRLAQYQNAMTPQDHAEILAADQGVADAERRSAAIEEAAACLKGV